MQVMARAYRWAAEARPAAGTARPRETKAGLDDTFTLCSQFFRELGTNRAFEDMTLLFETVNARPGEADYFQVIEALREHAAVPAG
jgi:hypothetical protein